MPLPILRGTTVPQQQRFTERYSPASGYVRELEWKGIDPAFIQLYANYYAAAGCEYDLEVAGGVAVLRATDNTGQITIDTWEIGVGEVLASSLKNPLNLAAISTNDLNVIARAIRDGSTLADAVTALNDDTGAGATVPSAADSLRLYQRMIDGSDSFFYSQYVLRHTTNVSNRYNVNVADQNVGGIYTPAQLLSETQNANSWIFPLPGRLAYKILQIPAPAVVSNYLWGWLKGASAESTAANNRVNIVTEYKLFQWSTDEYYAF